MKLCDYGCGQEAKHQFKNGKWCCSDHYTKCPIHRNKKTGEGNPFFNKRHSNDYKKKIKKMMFGDGNPMFGKIHSQDTLNKISTSLKGKMVKDKNPFFKKKHTIESRNKMSINLKYSIEQYKEKYPIFFKVEEMRYNPDKLGEKEIQVHCKNHNCLNSKEQDGWFTPTKTQMYERVRQVERECGCGGSYFYCCDECKQQCPLYNLRSDPFKNTSKPYTHEEYNQFRQYVLSRDKYTCQYCGEPATHVHHERPQKLEPFHALDPDYAWSCCEKCHYEKGHKKGTDCSTGNLANTICKD